MKIKFSKSVAYTPTWNGNRDLPKEEQISVILKPMEFSDLMLMMDAMGGSKTIKAAQDGASEAEITSQINITKVVAETADILLKYAEVTGLEGDDGPLNVGEISRYPAFAGLNFEILMQLTQISMPSEKSEGNSEGQQG